MKKSTKKLVVIGIIVLVILAGMVCYGFYGGKETDSVAVICDIGWDRVLCWKWHQGNAIEILKELGANL